VNTANCFDRSLRGFSAGLLIVILTLVSGTQALAQTCQSMFRQLTAYETVVKIEDQNYRHDLMNDPTPLVQTSYGTNIKILHSFEKEGLFYEDIAIWFPTLKPVGKAKLQARFDAEAKMTPSKRALTRWLQSIRPQPYTAPKERLVWNKLTGQQRLAELLKLDDPFAVLTVKERSQLFEDEILTFDEVGPGAKAPNYVTIGDDIGSYEVRLTKALDDRAQFRDLRDDTETYLDGKVGHQHKFHGWPDDAAERARIAPHYIELLDSSTWFLFWRQMRRDPEEISSILSHPYLGVYTRSSLGRLEKAVIENKPKRFQNKFRMIGARGFPAMKTVEGQADGAWMSDWELRSGNKGVKRDFTETLVEARLASGDYSGLNDFHSYKFDPSTPTAELLKPFVSESDLQVVAKFEELYPAMDFSPSPLSHNHIRNRIMSPLLPWGSRLDLRLKAEILKTAQLKYAEGLVAAAKTYNRKVAKGPMSPTALGELRQEIMEKLEVNIYEFAKVARLDADFERYLTPAPTVYPDINVSIGHLIDVNKIPLGIEYSFRFPMEARPRSLADATAVVYQLATDLAAINGKTPITPEVKAEGHGHGVAVNFKVPDKSGDLWRTEWDGIQRRYDQNGKVTRAWGGHIEVASPKFVPEQIGGSIADLFKTARKDSLIPRREAGGGHFNFDLGGLKQLPTAKGTRAVLNLISFFESNQSVILSIWMHPQREFAAFPIEIKPGFPEAIEKFSGNWDDLGRLLYEGRYFNTGVGRKPKYVPLNMTALMTPILPDMYRTQSLDIKNKKQAWFPSFGSVSKRVEARFFDAPLNEDMAGLQIKYGRALLNTAFNSETPIALRRRHTAEEVASWSKDPAAWFEAANAHLREIGLDPNEFKEILWDSYLIRSTTTARQRNYQEYQGFLPAKTGAEAPSAIATGKAG
jgi:hypothetical protein